MRKNEALDTRILNYETTKSPGLFLIYLCCIQVQTARVLSPNGDNAGVLQGDTLAPHLFITALCNAPINIQQTKALDLPYRNQEAEYILPTITDNNRFCR